MRNLEQIISCVICGYKQGGTTFFSSLVAADQTIDGRFETGLLQKKNPKELVQLPDKIKRNLIRFWRLPEDTFDAFSKYTNFSEVYEHLIKESHLDRNCLSIFDKFPDYIWSLPTVLHHYSGPIFFVARDPRAIYWSRQQRYWKKHKIPEEHRERMLSSKEQKTFLNDKSSIPIDKFSREYVKAFKVIEQIRESHPGRIHIFRLEDIVKQTDKERERLFAILNRPVPDLLFGDIQVSKEKVRPGIDLSIVDAYKPNLSEEVQNQILDFCSEAECYFHLSS